MEHLALMEKCLGNFPKKVYEKSIDYDKYFRESSSSSSSQTDNNTDLIEVKSYKLDSESLEHLSKMQSLTDIVCNNAQHRQRSIKSNNEEQVEEEQVENGKKVLHDDFLVLLRGLLCIDPSKRMTAEEAVESFGIFSSDPLSS